MTLISGLQPGLISGLQVGLNPSLGGIPQTLEGIAGAADPMQALIDAMVHTVKPDHLYIGNEAVGATELGGSGLDLVNTGVDQLDADTRLNMDGSCLFNATSDKMEVTDAAFDFGTASVAILNIYAKDAWNGKQIFSKYAGVTGIIHYENSSGHIIAYMRTAAGVYSSTVAIAHSTSEAQVDLLRRKTSTNDWDVWTREGTANTTEGTINALNVGAPLAIGKGAVSALDGNWGLTAIWKGAPGEDVTDAHRGNLLTWLGF